MVTDAWDERRAHRRSQRACGSLLFVALVVTAACSGGSPSVNGQQPETPVVVITDADVYTLDPARPWAEAFAYDVTTGRIIAVGDEAEVLAAVEGDHTVLAAGGAMVVPGFQDAHVHVPEAGINNGLCLLPAAEPLRSYEDLVADCADEQAGHDWVRAAGVSLFDFRGSDVSPLDVLDRAVPDRPAIVFDDLGHAVWVNSLGLEAAGVEANTPDPAGGVYERDEAGQLTGLLLENAQHVARDAAGVDPETARAGLHWAMTQLAAAGITTVSDAGGYWPQGFPEVWQAAADADELTVRGANALYLYPDRPFEEQLADLRAYFTPDGEDLLRYDTVKIYVDGILDLGTAALIEPYDVAVDPAFPNGAPYFATTDLQLWAQELHDLGYRLHFHAVGDAAVREALDAVEAIDAPDVAERRHRITHTYLVDPADIDRFAELGVVADFQIGPDSTDPAYADELSEIIGERAGSLIPVATLHEAGALVSLSSDWDADPLGPLGTIERAATRDRETITVADAIEMVTLNPAIAMGHENVTGSIEVGKAADFVLLDQNLLEVDPSVIAETVILATVVNGIVVFGNPAVT